MLTKLKVRPCLRRSGSRLREAPASAGVGRSRRQAEASPTGSPMSVQRDFLHMGPEKIIFDLEKIVKNSTGLVLKDVAPSSCRGGRPDPAVAA